LERGKEIVLNIMKSGENIITINGKRILYWQKNPEKKGVIILLHGFPGSHIGLIDMAATIKDYRIIIPDLPACGQSELLEEKHTLENYAKWLNDFMKNLSIEDTIIIGHSFGSRVALFFSIYYPERIKKMVLITPVLKVDGLITYFIALHCNIAKLLPKYLRKTWLSNGFYHKVSHAIIFKSSDFRKRRQIMHRNFQESKNVDHRAAMEIFDEFYKSNLINMSDKSKVKSLIIAGGNDEIVSLNSIKELSNKLINCEVKIMENSGHLVPLEKPLATVKIIQSWLSSPFGSK